MYAALCVMALATVGCAKRVYPPPIPLPLAVERANTVWLQKGPGPEGHLALDYIQAWILKWGRRWSIAREPKYAQLTIVYTEVLENFGSETRSSGIAVGAANGAAGPGNASVVGVAGGTTRTVSTPYMRPIARLEVFIGAPPLEQPAVLEFACSPDPRLNGKYERQQAQIARCLFAQLRRRFP